MRLVDKDALKRCRNRGRCAWCGRAGPLDAHHIFSAGAGRVDHDWNLAPLCRACHCAHHSGARPLRCDLLAISAARFGVRQSDIEDIVWRVRRAAKGSDYATTNEAGPARRDGHGEGTGADGVCREVPAERAVDRGAGLEAEETDGGWVSC